MGRRQGPEKSLVEHDVYAGLQVDDRPRALRSKFHGLSPRSLDEKVTSPTSYGSESAQYTSPTFTSPSYWAAAYGTDALSPNSSDWHKNHQSSSTYAPTPGTAGTFDRPKEDDRRICGLKRKTFWIGFALILFFIIMIAALVGGLVGGLYRKRDTKPAREAPAPPTQNFPAAQQGDVMIGSPLCTISYDMGGTNEPAKRQEFRMYFQSLYGNVKEAISQGSSSWQNAKPILTDAVNNTGLATFTYLNGTSQQGSLFYVGTNGLLQEKRKIYSDSQYWQVGKLNNLNLAMAGNLTSPENNGDPQNSWDSYSFTAVYSRNFSTGPGARLFYHAQYMNSTAFVQEMIWIQTNDSWIKGAELADINPNSRLAASIDESQGTLRLFYSTGNKSLEERMTRLQGDGRYRKTVRIEGYLNANNADLAAVSANGTTYLYHYSSKSASPGIKELVITSEMSSNPASPAQSSVSKSQSGVIPGSGSGSGSGNSAPSPPSSSSQLETRQSTPSSSTSLKAEKFNLTEPLVASPLLPGGSNSSLYQPIDVVLTAVRDLQPQLLVFWVENPTGDPATNNTGYQSLVQVSRTVKAKEWPSGTQLQVPLGSENSDPH